MNSDDEYPAADLTIEEIKVIDAISAANIASTQLINDNLALLMQSTRLDAETSGMYYFI